MFQFPVSPHRPRYDKAAEFAASLVREYVANKGYTKLVKELDATFPKGQRVLRSRAELSKQLQLQPIVDAAEPAMASKSLLELLTLSLTNASVQAVEGSPLRPKSASIPSIKKKPSVKPSPSSKLGLKAKPSPTSRVLRSQVKKRNSSGSAPSSPAKMKRGMAVVTCEFIVLSNASLLLQLVQ
eukprot:m.25546 g.25546  ORF g.25546 m.25546 type:complete len:183 (+) comp7715_c0_seq1:89-637(+)